MEPVAEGCVSLPVDDIGDCRVPNAPVTCDDTLTEEHSLTERAGHPNERARLLRPAILGERRREFVAYLQRVGRRVEAFNHQLRINADAVLMLSTLL